MYIYNAQVKNVIIKSNACHEEINKHNITLAIVITVNSHFGIDINKHHNIKSHFKFLLLLSMQQSYTDPFGKFQIFLIYHLSMSVVFVRFFKNQIYCLFGTFMHFGKNVLWYYYHRLVMLSLSY